MGIALNEFKYGPLGVHHVYYVTGHCDCLHCGSKIHVKGRAFRLPIDMIHFCVNHRGENTKNMLRALIV